MKKLYISPKLEIIRFVTFEKLATDEENDPQWQNGEGSTSETIDATFPGSQVPGWGN